MLAVFGTRDRVICLSPLERPDLGVAVAAQAAGAIGIVDLGRDVTRGKAVLSRVPAGVGVRVPDGASYELPRHVDLVMVGEPSQVAAYTSRDRRVLAQVTSVDEARAALAAGAWGLIAKGCEAGGRVGDETTFVLVQHLVGFGAPIWAQGGIGELSAAACVAGGAKGVVLDTQLALVRESSLGTQVRGAIAAMDGSETLVVNDRRVFARPDLPIQKLVADNAPFGGDDLYAQLLPLGQDAAFAKHLADTHVTAGGVARGIAGAIARGLELAVEHPLGPDSAFAQRHGLKYPIAQGPMSRVSDRAKFAAAVAEAGGLPFLALTLMSGAEVRELMLETKQLVGELPWGVGILGFVPPEVREAQLEVIRELGVPMALIAGGRPSQSAPLEAQGTPTFLHVPSPGLLDLFLKDGARRFVFEGSECGGHVGPRTSFVLWEQQVQRLLACDCINELDVLFAGGIHDQRSASMVAALAAPLAAKGARIGVLMGTAYLFTHEAVACGAIEPAFQEQAIACERTVLLETSPGHATRCADTEFALQFAAEKARLASEGVDPKVAWAQLEQLNLGRLRIAAKALKRDGETIATVDEATQQREGMYMIGQVAALRSGTCSIAELHADVCDHRPRADELMRPSSADLALLQDVAIVGVAAIFPGAPDTDAFWANIVAGTNNIREVPPERWDVATYYDPNATGVDAGKKTPCKWGGFLDDVPFDPLAYGIPPKSLAAIEPVQLLALEIAKRALADAGYEKRSFDRARTAVIFGAEAGTDLSTAYSFRAMFPHFVGEIPEALHGLLPELSEDSFPGVLSNVIAGRIANRLDLGGVNYTVDAACAASLAALDMSVKELVAGSSDMVLCGGADLHNSINDYLMFSSVHALSPTGQCHTFDAKADGIVLGEGVACIVLKRLADAERDGDRIYAVIKGVAGASDGKSLGLTAPRKEGQVRALERAYEQAGVSPVEVGLVEAHGTGTVVGDRTELGTLTDVFTNAGAKPNACVLGSVKSNIGHTKCAAGMAGVIKAALSIHHGVLPPTLNMKQPNPAYKRDTSPFVFLDKARPWVAKERVAAVSAFGFGGTNFHAVLAQHDGGPSAGEAWNAELVLIRGADRATALNVLDRVDKTLASEPRLRDLARTTGAMPGPVQLAIVAESCADLKAKLAKARAFEADGKSIFVASNNGGRDGKLAFLCPGQGSQKPGMLADLFVAFPRLHRILSIGAPWAGTMLPPAAFGPDEQKAQATALTDTRVAQPALGMADLAVAELLAACGVLPDMLAGHSYGELAALAIAGVFDEPDLLDLSATRGDAILDAAAAAGGDTGTMAAVSASAEQILPHLAGTSVVIANHNSPKQSVISGGTKQVAEVMERLAGAKLAAKKIPVACAFHSSIVAGARHALAQTLAELDVRTPDVPVYSNTTAAAYPSEPDAIRAQLAQQVAEPVKFAQELAAMYDAGARVFVECGPGQVLTRLTAEILGDRPHVAIACDGSEPGVKPILRALAAMAAAGVPVDPSALFTDRDASIIALELDAKPARVKPWLVSGHRVRPVGDESMPHKPIGLPTAAPVVAPAPVAGVVGERDGVVLEYLRGMRSMIQAQRDVMLSYLGSVPAPMIDVVSQPVVAQIAAPIVLPAPAPAPQPNPIETHDPMQLVVSIVSERTGYPVETLGIDLDLEADLSIDSIKRIEIIGELAQRLGLRVEGKGGTDAIVEELATRKTLRSLVAWLVERLDTTKPAPAAASELEELVTNPEPDPEIEPAVSARGELRRYKLHVVETPAPLNGHTSFSGKRFAIYDGGAIGDALAHALIGEGAIVTRADDGDASRLANLDGFVDLGVVDGVSTMRAMFERVRGAVLGGARVIYVATMGGELGRGGFGGPAGLIKTLAAEFPDVRARVVDLESTESPAEAAAKLHGELHASDHHLEIGYIGGVRSSFEVVPAEVIAGGVALDESSVVLVTGGARGITAKAAIALANRYGCKIELVGRSALPGKEDAAVAAARDAKALRTLLAKAGGTPAIIEARVARVLADREIRATLAALGDRATYHAVDVRSPELGELIDELYERHGRIDAVIHGAGILEDKLIRHKTAESFERVFATKLVGARTLVDKLRDDVKLVVMFSSISGAFGNRGQVDYAAAGDALDKLAWTLQRKINGRVVSIDWGPWAGAGMVSPDLEREYARRQIGLIDPDAGVEALLAELHGERGDAQVILTAADPRAFARAHRDDDLDVS
jgi:acyl transferase domain-containing protein/NAD(P)H-dependent flavin oxidoreductase YrpB (nitropropane dioxygenase family)/NAD(P)-dependent dehydrogenase (short-subunit alcohol dehydrogenase family)/acyl carrier protein